MPRFYFDIHNGLGDDIDQEGVVLSSAEAAQQEAVKVLTDVARTHPVAADPHRIFVEVRDAEKKAILRVKLTLEVVAN